MRSLSVSSDAKTLNHLSDFADIAQDAAERFYLIPFPTKKDLRENKQINRVYHGALHACSVALNVEMFIAFYQKHFPDLLKTPDGDPFDDEIIKLLMLAGIYHDAMNVGEAFYNEQIQAENFKKEMLALGFDESKVNDIAEAIANKDTKPATNIYAKIIHDADCFDILRMRELTSFRKNELYLHQHIQESKQATLLDPVLDRMIHHHHAVYEQLKEGNTHKACEWANNCFNHLKQKKASILQDHIFIECLKKEKQISKRSVPKFSVLELYDEDGEKIKSIIDKLLATEGEVKSKPPLDLEQTQLIRCINNFDVEFDQLDKNKLVLERHEIKKQEELKAYVTENNEAPPGFKWRPTSCINKNFISSIFVPDRLAVIIDGGDALVPYLYKQNCGSNNTAFKGAFKYDRQTGGFKNKKNITALTEKLHENNKRRNGIDSDRGLHYFGQYSLGHSEILLTYNPNDINAIIVPDNNDPDIAKEALLLCAEFDPAPRFYRHSPVHGLRLVDKQDIIDQSCILSTFVPKVVRTLESLNNLISLDSNQPVLTIAPIQKYTGDRQDFKNMELASQSLILDDKKIERENIKLIKELFDQFKAEKNKYTVWTVGGTDLIEMSIEENAIKIEMWGQEDSVLKQFDIYWIELLQRIQQCIQSREAFEISNLENELDCKQIKDIFCPAYAAKDSTLSSSNPLRFEFTHPKNPEIQCVASTKDNITQIEFYKEEKMIQAIPTKKLRDIGIKYYEQEVGKCNNYIKDVLSEKLKTKHINDLQFELKKKGEKFFVEITLDKPKDLKEEELENDDVIKYLIDLLKLPVNEPKLLKIRVENEKVIIHSLMVQDIGLYLSKLRNCSLLADISSQTSVAENKDLPDEEKPQETLDPKDTLTTALHTAGQEVYKVAEDLKGTHLSSVEQETLTQVVSGTQEMLKDLSVNNMKAHEENIQKITAMKDPKWRLLKGAMLAALGVALITVAVSSVIMSFGGSAPVAAPLIAIGATIIKAAGVTMGIFAATVTLTGIAGIGMTGYGLFSENHGVRGGLQEIFPTRHVS